MRPHFTVAVSGQRAAATPDASLAERWNLADLYASLDAWHADAARLAEQMAEFGLRKGKLGASAVSLRDALDARADMLRRLYRLGLFSSEQLAQDTSVADSLALDQRCERLAHQFDEATAFVSPEILALGAPTVERFLAADPGLHVHRHPLARILRAAQHTLDDAGEALVARFGHMSGAGQAVHGMLTDADMPWPRFKLAGGEEITLDQTAYFRHRESADRGERQRVMDTFFGVFKTYERSMGVMLYSQLKQDAVYSAVRRYPDSITRVLDDECMPVAVVDTLIAQANANLPTLHRYCRLRAQMLGVADMAYHDLFSPLVKGDFKYPIALGRRLMLEAATPLGPAYVQQFQTGLNSRWMDTLPRPRKQSGAHMAGHAYDVHPYVLMNYSDDYESLTTLAHEWGHAMHSVLANESQPFVTANYSTFVAEIASTFNEALLLECMLKAAKSDDERIFYLDSALERLRGTFFRQAMLAEFERNIHAAVDAGESLTGEDFSAAYGEVQRRHHGVAEGVMTIAPAYSVEWSFIPHFYEPFYVYQYATSIAASSLFADEVMQGRPGALERYLGLLRAGGSGYPYDLVKAAGVDLATAAPCEAIVARMNRLMDQIEALRAR